MTAERSLTEFFCGRCDHAWTVADPERRKAPRPVKRHPSDAPRPSRS